MSPLMRQARYSEPVTAELAKTRFRPVQWAVAGFFIGTAISIASRHAGFCFAEWLLPLALAAAGLALALDREQLHYQKEIIAHLQSQLLQRAVIDETTDLYNHDFFLKEAAREMERSKRYGRVLSALLIDVRGFRRMNEEHGNVAADGALRAVADVIQKGLRKVDTLGRYGGDEFLVLLPGAKASDAGKVGDRIRHSVKSKPFAYDGKTIPLDVDVRVLPCGMIGELDVLALAERADKTIAEMRAAPASR